MARHWSRVGLVAMFASLLACIALEPSALRAQNFYGSIVGSVADSSGAIVPGATVTITDVATNEKHTAQSNGSGEFSFVSLVPSTYSVDVQKANFKHFVRNQVIVEVNATVRVDVAMEVGTATETVEVNTETPLLQTDSPTLGAVVEGKTIDEMPLNGRNTMNLLALAPGVVPTANTAGGVALGSGGHTAASNWSAYSIGGGLVGQSTMYLDGEPLNMLGGGGGGSISFVPTQDAVQEFSIASNASTSEFGRYSGGVVNMATKSGTNSWHGTAYEYVRNKILNANDWFNKAAELTQGKRNTPAQWNQNQYGVEVGGPIKRDKLFAMFSWEAFSARESSLQQRSVPTADMLTGILDFAAPGAANTLAITQAMNTAIANAPAACQATANYSTNQVQLNHGVMTSASGCFDPTSLIIMTEYPAPTPGFQNNPSNNFQQLSGYGSDTDNFIGRMDYTLNAKQRLFGRIVKSDLGDLTQEWAPGGKMPGGGTWHIGGGTTHNRALAGVLGDTYTLTPSTVMDLRLSVTRTYNDQVPPTAGNPADFSILGSNWVALGKSMTVTNIPEVNFGAGTGFGSQCSGYVCSPVIFANAGQDSYQWNDNEGLVFSLTKIFGQHNLKFGGETRFMDRYVISLSGGNQAGGTLQVNNTYFTQNYWGNFLLGDIDTATMATVREVASYNWYQGYYINDTWEATPKLTINAGVRWELPGNVAEKHDNSIELEPGVIDSSSATTSRYNGTSIIGTAVLVNTPIYPNRGDQPARHDLFAPNLGFAYRMTNNDVIRAGYGYSIAAIDIASGIFPENFSINAAQTTWNYDTNGQTIHYPINNPFPVSAYPNGLNQPVTRATYPSGYLTTAYVGSNVTAPVATLVVPTTQQWNFTVSHQFPGNMSIEAGYAGSVAHGLPMGYDYNELPSTYWADQSMEYKNNQTPPSTLVTSSQLTYCQNVLGSGTTSYGQCARPYAAYQNFNDALGPYGFVNYQSLPVRFQKRFKSGGMVNASYTWAKTLGNTGGGTGGPGGGGGGVQDWDNLRAEKSITSYDIPRRLVASYVYSLPFGQGQLFLANANHALNTVVSGWTVNGITTFQDGFPVGLGVSLPHGETDVPNQFGAGLRPNYQQGCPRLAGGSWKSHVIAGTPVINTACWSIPPVTYSIGSNSYATTLGNEPRIDPQIKAPGYNNWDLTLQKTTKISERMNLEFRWEQFNAFNHVRFGAPGSTVNGNGFGIITGEGSSAEPRLDQLSLRLNF